MITVSILTVIAFGIWWWFVIFRDPTDPDNPKYKENE
jgi:hypothetical protein